MSKNLEELINHCSNKSMVNNEIAKKDCKNINEDREMAALLYQVKLKYSKRPKENKVDKQLKNKIDCY